MGESKRRKDLLGDDYGQPSPSILPGLPLTKKQADQALKLTTRGAWAGIILLALYWVTLRFIGPAMGWWHLN